MAKADPKQPLAGLKLGDRVLEARRNAGHTNRVEFCALTKLSYSNLHKIEMGVTVPTDATLRRIGQHTGYSVLELRGNTGDNPSGPRKQHVPYDAWKSFLKTEEGTKADPFHIDQLAGLRFTGEPTVSRYVIMLAMLSQPD